MIRRLVCCGLVTLGLTAVTSGDFTAPAADLADMIAAAEPGSVVTIPKGLYQAPRLVIDKSITLRGERKDRWAVVIQSQIRITARDVRLENLTVCGTLSPCVEDRRGHGGKETLVTAENAHRLHVRNCVIRYGRNSALRLQGSNNVVIEGCLVTENGGTAVNVSACDDLLLRNNIFNKNIWFGIETNRLTNSRMEGNVIRDSGWTAVWLHGDSLHNTIVNNTISGSDVGLTIASSHNLIENNYLLHNSVAVGVLTGPFHRTQCETGGRSDDDCSIGDVTVRDNAIVNSRHVGVLVRDGVGHKIERNMIRDAAQSGIAVIGDSLDVALQQNDIARCGLWAAVVCQSQRTLIADNRVRNCRAAVRLVESAETVVTGLLQENTQIAVLCDAVSRRSTRSDTRPIEDTASGLRLLDGEKRIWSVGGQTYEMLTGDFHVHTTNSDGAGRLIDAYIYGRDVLGLDYMAVSDHTDSPMQSLDSTWWQRQMETANALNATRGFTAISGMEVTYPAHIYGHFNVYYVSDKGHPYPLLKLEENDEVRAARALGGYEGIMKLLKLGKPNPETATVEDLGNSIAQDPDDAFVISHHYFRTPEYWDKTPRMPGYLLATEICSRHGIWETAAGPSRVDVATGQTTPFADGLSAGWKIAVIGGSDTHFGTACDSARAVVYSKENTRAGIRDALRDRRSYATTGARIVLEFSADDHPMGAEYRTGQAPLLTALIDPTGDFQGELELLRNDQVIRRVAGSGALQLSYQDRDFGGKATYYRVRYARSDGEQAWSSPIWISGPQTDNDAVSSR